MTGDVGGAGPVDQRADVGDDLVPVVRARHDAVLHVDDDQGGVGPVVERGHLGSPEKVDRGLGPP